MDVPVALLLAGGLFLVLLPASEPSLWSWHRALAAAFLVIALVLFCAWVVFESRSVAYLVTVGPGVLPGRGWR